MANQTITTNTNHDALTGRSAGQNITIQQGAVLTIDSYPQDTTSGILGDLTITSGEIHIDGRYVREVFYNSGTGTLPSVGASVTYGTSGTAKIINLTSGNNASGVVTVTIQGDLEEPNGTITDGTWSASITSSKVGLLKVYGEEQIWDAVNGTCTFRVTGDWYELGVGTGLNNQTINLPHNGRQHALWIETGNGTGVFKIWHKVPTTASDIYFDSVSDWGNDFECGFVFSCVAGSGVVNFGTSTNGGVPPTGARIRMPNVHLGTTTVASPQTEVISNVLSPHIQIVDNGVTENVFIDHLNASTVDLTLNQTSGATISDSALGISNATFIRNNAAPITITNCGFVGGQNIGTEGPSNVFTVLDNLGGITLTDCVIAGGRNASNSGAMILITMANFTFEGTNKLVSLEQDENSMSALRMTSSSRIVNNGTLLLLNGGATATSGCVNLQLGDIAWGQLSSRGSTENSLSILNIAATDTLKVNSGRFLQGNGVEGFRGAQITLTDVSNATIQNFGSVESKLDNGGFATRVFNLAGISNNIIFRRCYFTNVAASQMLTTVNSVSGVVMENCGADYNDELERDASNVLTKGVHCGSGALENTTGVEGDLINCVGTVFYDHFRSDTTGAFGLTFTLPGSQFSSNFQIVSGAPIFNGIGDLLMPSGGDQVIYTWPYSILGHTELQNSNLRLFGVNTGNLLYEYDLDTGSGFSGIYKEVTGANLSGEIISPTGFRPRIRITTQTSGNNSISGFAIDTNTTILAQADNLYPLKQVLISATVLANSRVQVYNVTKDEEIDNVFVTGTSYSVAVTTEAEVDDVIRLRVTKKGYEEAQAVAIFTGFNLSFLITQEEDEVYGLYGLDGETITKFTPDYLNNQVDLNISSNFSASDFYAWYSYNLTTEQGVRNFFGAVTAVDVGNIRINTSALNLRFDNLTSTNVFQNDNVRIFRSDDQYPVINPTTGGGGIDLVWRNQVYTISVGGGSGGGDDAATIYTYFTSSSREDAFKADVSGLATQSSVDVIDANVDLILADTNELQTNQGNWITATGFSTFNPATDSVTVGSMNNNVITSSVVANNAFNNTTFTTGFFNSINSEVDQALADYDAPTKTELDAAISPALTTSKFLALK